VPILLQKSFGAAPRKRAENAIPTVTRLRIGIPRRKDGAERNSIRSALYQ